MIRTIIVLFAFPLLLIACSDKKQPSVVDENVPPADTVMEEKKDSVYTPEQMRKSLDMVRSISGGKDDPYGDGYDEGSDDGFYDGSSGNDYELEYDETKSDYTGDALEEYEDGYRDGYHDGYAEGRGAYENGEGEEPLE